VKNLYLDVGVSQAPKRKRKRKRKKKRKKKLWQVLKAPSTLILVAFRKLKEFMTTTAELRIF